MKAAGGALARPAKLAYASLMGGAKRRSVRRGVLVLGCLGLGACLAPACGSDDADAIRRAKLAEGCLINTDCQSPLVCAFRACHVQCNEQRDCPAGELCVPTDKPFKVCMFEKEQQCAYHTDCPANFKCVFSKCRPECKTDKDCVSGQKCAEGSCAVEAEVDADGGLIPPADASLDASLGKSCVYHSDCPGNLHCVGGSCQAECKTDKDCPLGATCQAAACELSSSDAGVDSGPGACGNGVQDPGETGVDCGGVCGSCPNAACTKPSDCASHVCVAQTCAAPSCTDGLQNGNESDTDCGGNACSKCPAPKGCWTGNDCVEGKCVAGSCTSPGCTDGTTSGNETDTDCGGPDCTACADGKACKLNTDCKSGNCVAKTCKPAGAVNWVEAFLGEPRVAADPSGNLLVAGSAYGTQDIAGVPFVSAGNNDVFAGKLTPAGATSWLVRLGGSGGETLADVTVDSKGNLLLLLSTTGGGSFAKPLSCPALGVAIVKLSSDKGAEVWSKCLTIGAGTNVEPYAIATDAKDDVYIGGRYYGSIDFGGSVINDVYSQGFVAKYSGVTGDLAWGKELTSTPGIGAPVRDLVGDGNDVVAAGEFNGTADFSGKPLTSASANPDAFVARFAGPDGSGLLAKRFGDSGADSATAVARDGSGALVVAGNFSGQVDFGAGPVVSGGGLDVFLTSVNGATFSPTWAKTFGGSADDKARGLAIKSNGEIALVAEMSAAANFGGGSLPFGGQSDGVLARYSPAGVHLASKSWGSNSVETVTSVAFTSAAIGLAGTYASGIVDVGTGPLPSGKSGFFAHLLP